MRRHNFLWYVVCFVTLLLLSPKSILSQDNAVPSATPPSASSTSALKEQFNTLAVRLAARLADTIARSKDHSLIVFDFVGPDRTLGALGAALADDLSTALAESPVKLRVKDHSDLNKLMEENGLESENIFDPGIAIWLAEDLDTQAFVLGKLERDAGSMKLSVMTYNVRDGRAIVGLSVAIPLTDEMKGLIPDTIEKQAANTFVSSDGKCDAIGLPPCGGANGYSNPKCLRCPQPAYSEEAIDRKVQGTVLIVIIVDEKGRAKDIRVARALPYGLTRQAIQAIQKWTFQPATGPDGKPGAVRQLIEVSFHLF